MPPAAPPPRPYHHGNLRQALLAASLELIQAKGVRALTLREIGAHLHVSRSAPYRHFPSKSDLLAALSDLGFAALAVALRSALAAATPGFSSQMDALAVSYVRFAAEHPAYYEVMFGAEAAPRQDEAPGFASPERPFGILQKTIQDGQAEGVVRPGEPLQLALLAWSLVHGISLLRRNPNLPIDDSDGFPRFCSTLLRVGLQLPELPLSPSAKMNVV